MRQRTDVELIQLESVIPWLPQAGPQHQAFCSKADVVLYGGAAGGGKTDLAIGLAITQHRETLFIRREAKQLGAVLDRISAIIDPTRNGWSGQEGRWLIPQWDGNPRQVVIGSTPAAGDENKYQGRPRDLLVVDEAANMLESQVRFLMGWVRSTLKGQRCRTLLCSNPPTTAEGYWLTEMFSPWLDPNHKNPAESGELRWYAMEGGNEVERPDGSPYIHGGEKVIPQSRTFIPAKLDDNEYLRDTGYRAVLQALPEPLRTQMLYGDFSAGRDDHEWQVIPSAWVDMAMERWQERELDPMHITSVGVDPSRGGRDGTVIACRSDWHYCALTTLPGSQVPDSKTVAREVIRLAGRSHSPIHVDVIGIGAAVIDTLDMFLGGRTVPINAASAAGTIKDITGAMKFINKRAEMWWRFRDLLNPANGRNLELPPDAQLRAELCAPTYSLVASGIKIEKKEEIIKRLGRSTDKADAVIMAATRTPLATVVGQGSSKFSAIGQVTR